MAASQQQQYVKLLVTNWYLNVMKEVPLSF